MTISDDDLKDILTLAADATHGPWAYRPEEFDDWGFVRGNRSDSLPGDLIAVTKKPYLSEEELSTHRTNGTDPCAGDGKYVARLDPDTVKAIVTELLALRHQSSEGATEAKDEALHRIAQWADAYPLEVFPEPDWDDVKAKLGGNLLSCVSASNMRHVVEGVGKIARAALAPQTSGGE